MKTILIGIICAFFLTTEKAEVAQRTHRDFLKWFKVPDVVHATLTTTDAKKILAATFTNYTSAKSLEIKYSVTSGGVKAETSTFYTSGKNSYYESASYASLSNSAYVITVKHDLKKITITKTLHGKGQLLPVNGFDAVSKSLDKYKLKATEQGNVVRISVEENDGLLQDVVYEINKANHTLLKMEYAVKAPAAKKSTKTVVEYVHTDFNKKFDKGFFDENRILKKSGKTFIAADKKYSGYKIVDLTK